MTDPLCALPLDAPREVHAIIDGLARTEDVRFSPSNRRLAIAAFARNRIAIFDIELGAGRVGLPRGIEFTAPALNYPHGLDFLDEETLIVANRFGGVVVFKLPPGDLARWPRELTPIDLLDAEHAGHLNAPGSVSIASHDEMLHEILICNNEGHSVTRHLIDRGKGSIVSSEPLLGKGLAIPDGVAMSFDRRWVAVSNHNTHSVLVYARDGLLTPRSDPDGILRGVHYPHGLRFTADGAHLIVADAGAPYIHIYAGDSDGWYGVRMPFASLRIMDDSTFMRGRNNLQEGGPKGIDIDGGARVLVATSEHQPLAFFDLQAMLAQSGRPAELAMAYELHLIEQIALIWDRARKAELRARAAEREAARQRHKVRRVPKILRRLFGALRRRGARGPGFRGPK